ncbi:hypothetical protein CaCOL14_011875 [Colletotrichum acutatum]|uniref:Uncharacterized protein n=1 Tax=Glomerella acutata TaxID=27357 RepID=A0AAD8U6N9_GLOAC|nr:uncharacterized protein BDZ83DRAFT_645463 [Colletotrichum acutatum]KAK1702002.1 hypothetical protein BDZ83DRAFT_645463 [Colletotrichum acutatum]
MPSANPIRFDGRVAIVTGSGSGLGRGYAFLLARLGASVIVNSRTSATTQETVSDIINAGGKAVPFVGNVTNPSDAQGIVDAAIKTYGRIDIVINNAGWMESKPFEAITHKELLDMFDSHVGGSFNVTHAAWPHLKKQKYGRIVMIVSHTMLGMPNTTAYGGAKMGVMGFAKSLSTEGKEHNILVNSIAVSGYSPGVQAGIKDEGLLSLMKNVLPAADVAPTVLWLAHEDFKASGEVFSAAGKIVSRIYVAETRGFQGSAGEDWTIELIRDSWDQVIDEKDYTVRTTGEQAGPELFARLTAGQSEVSDDAVRKAMGG